VTEIRPAVVVVLAAGEGKRMHSSVPKVLHRMAGRPLLDHVLRAADRLSPAHTVVVVGHGREQVIAHLAAEWPHVTIAIQEQQLGTGHAARTALDVLASSGVTATDLAALGPVLVLYGDAPLLTSESLKRLLADADVGVLTAVVADPAGYGRIVRDSGTGEVLAIVEHREADAEQLAIAEINSGVYTIEPVFLTAALERLSKDNSQGEEYLTDVVAIAKRDGLRVVGVLTSDADELLGVNDRAQLAGLSALLRDRIVDAAARSGVTFQDPRTTWVDVDVELEPDATILRNTELLGNTRIASGATVGPDSTLRDVVVGAGARVRSTTAAAAEIGAGAEVGPFTYLRPGTVLGKGSKAGAYVEIKASTVGAGSKVPHLSYVGDASIGVGTNIGAATVFVNFDGEAKHRTTVGDHVRIGSDSMLVAPLTIGDGAYTAAGSVITDDVPPGALAVARGRQRSILGWVQRRRPGSASALAAEAAQTSRSTDSTNGEESHQ
jgi:bifunctional UDP-N-acetylglucosamine pyrophosphorylase/glucosamine-1-phosphate N-acetyltransferase